MDVSTAAVVLISLVFSVGAQAPVLSMEPRVSSVRQGESISFRCRVAGGEQPVQLEWRKAHNQPLADNVKIGPDHSVMTVAGAQPGNQGQYRCVASNPAGRTTVSAVLNEHHMLGEIPLDAACCQDRTELGAVLSVLSDRLEVHQDLGETRIKQGHPPTVTLTRAGTLRVRVGEPVSIECRATGRPRPSLKWKRQGSTLDLATKATDDVNTIEWTAVRPEDSEEVTAIQGHTVTMECQATGSPTPLIAWSKLRAPLPWRHAVSGGVLTLTDVGRQDSGQYICNATNAHGYSEAYVQMEVETPPYATCLPDQLRLRVGDPLRLQCLAHGSPPVSFRWSRVGGSPVLAPSAETTVDGQLLIARVKATDGGTYKCVASNHVGSGEAMAKVVVVKSEFRHRSGR
ncbi:hypothetical protein NHX12_018856 [Muraenolepis orangiensis]|uniref:Ig-like domain-containing protein n=1 Tax=Muraenolepis orangiensis TaxID=630683 RepID=A0A9Q0F0E7_9TELE|nr:hypothetical protein NHX12_018856 [Muraenolepis orangiensis]